MSTSPIYNARVRQMETGVIDHRLAQLGANVAVDIGYLLVNVAGYYVIPAAGNAATGKDAVVSMQQADNTGGANGALTVEGEKGTYDFVNSGANPLAQANVGSTVYAEDYQTVGSLNTAGPAVGILVAYNPANALPGRLCRVKLFADK